MERGSAKHSPKLDDELKREFEPIERGGEGHVEPHRETEDVDEGTSRDAARATRGSLSRAEAENRSAIARHLPGSVFPGTKDELIAAAGANRAPDAMLMLLRALPDDARFDRVEEVWEALGGAIEYRR